MNLEQKEDRHPEISIVVPVFNESDGIAIFLEQLTGALKKCAGEFEIWAVDDGSGDATWECLGGLRRGNSHLHALRFTRNFGKEAAILAGLRHARGRAVIVMDADGQHPIAVLPEMIALWRSGKAQIVAAQKTGRPSDKLLARCNAWLFNRTMHALTGLDLQGASDFRLLDRHVVDTLLAFPEHVRFFRGMTVWTGFTTARLGFEVAPRIAGASQWSNAQLTRLAITAITSYSAKPLSLVFRLGLLGMVAAVLLLLQALYSWATDIAVSGWTSLTVVVLFFGSATLLGIGVVGAYLAQIFDEIKARPEFLVAERLDDADGD
ncbi:MAG: glycosyltransferase [Rhodocyclaceae bacterium]|nr:MAG: glycosyltransferase [Rhodocyclaceae bacterium]